MFKKIILRRRRRSRFQWGAGSLAIKAKARRGNFHRILADMQQRRDSGFESERVKYNWEARDQHSFVWLRADCQRVKNITNFHNVSHLVGGGGRSNPRRAR